MADYTLDQDYLSIALAATGSFTPEQETATDWLSAVTTTTETKGDQLFVDPEAVEVRIWDGNATYYKMRGMDQVTDGLYDTWVVQGNPDFGAARYVGALGLPLRDVCIIDVWTA